MAIGNIHLLALGLAVCGAAQAATETPFTRTEEREPCSDYTAQRRPHFGDFHVHTAWSFDANSQDTRNKPADAYRFARGEAMGIQPYNENGVATRTIKLDRPLDFTAVTDHSEFMGEMRMCTTKGSPGYWHPVCMAIELTVTDGESPSIPVTVRSHSIFGMSHEPFDCRYLLRSFAHACSSCTAELLL